MLEKKLTRRQKSKIKHRKLSENPQADTMEESATSDTNKNEAKDKIDDFI